MERPARRGAAATGSCRLSEEPPRWGEADLLRRVEELPRRGAAGSARSRRAVARQVHGGELPRWGEADRRRAARTTLLFFLNAGSHSFLPQATPRTTARRVRSEARLGVKAGGATDEARPAQPGGIAAGSHDRSGSAADVMDFSSGDVKAAVMWPTAPVGEGGAAIGTSALLRARREFRRSAAPARFLCFEDRGRADVAGEVPLPPRG